MPLPAGDDHTIVSEPVEPEYFPEPDEPYDDDPSTWDIPPPPPEPPQPPTVDIDPVASLEFDARHREDFDGLLHLGALTHSFNLHGHRFVIHTLSTDELLRVSLLVKGWEGSLGHNRAYLTAMAAACCDSVDDRPLFTPIGPNDDEVEGRFRYARAHWFPWTGDAIYEKLMALEARVTEILSQMGEGSS